MTLVWVIWCIEAGPCEGSLQRICDFDCFVFALKTSSVHYFYSLLHNQWLVKTQLHLVSSYAMCSLCCACHFTVSPFQPATRTLNITAMSLPLEYQDTVLHKLHTPATACNYFHSMWGSKVRSSKSTVPIRRGLLPAQFAYLHATHSNC